MLDLDGTLAETDSLHFEGWAKLLRPHGYEIDRDFYQRRISGRLNPDIVDDLLPDLPRPEAMELVEAKEAAFRELAGELQPLEGLVAFIKSVREAGIPLALVTNAPKENADAVLGALGLEKLFDAEVLAEEVGVGKPDPAPYVTALERLSVSGEAALAFEDSPSGVRSAAGAGIFTVGVASTHDPGALAEAGAEITVFDFTDPRLARLLRR